MNTLLLTVAFDDRFGLGKISSRIGLSESAVLFDSKTNLYQQIQNQTHTEKLHCILVDEAQFLSKDQVWQLSEVCDRLNIPVLCYGIRTDFQGELFTGSQWLLAWADELEELKTICHCGSKATMVIRVDEHGLAIHKGSQIEIGGNDRYLSLCRKHFKSSMTEPKTQKAPELSL